MNSSASSRNSHPSKADLSRGADSQTKLGRREEGLLQDSVVGTGRDVVDSILQNYERLDDEVKAELPLKKIWVMVREDDK